MSSPIHRQSLSDSICARRSTQAMRSLNSIHPSHPTISFINPRRRAILSLALAFLFLLSLPIPYTNRYQMHGAAVAAVAKPIQLNLNALIDALQARYGRMQGLAAD